MQLYFGGKRACSVTQSCPILCELMMCSPPDSSVHGIIQARILEWVAISFLRGSSRPRDRTESPGPPALAGTFFTWREVLIGEGWGVGLNFFCNVPSKHIPSRCQKFNHGQYYISFLQRIPSFRDIVCRSQRWDSSKICLHSHPLRAYLSYHVDVSHGACWSVLNHSSPVCVLKIW